MSYVDPNFQTKKRLRKAVAAGKPVYVYEPGLGSLDPGPGEAFVEGPHFPKPHSWYATVAYDANKMVTRVVL